MGIRRSTILVGLSGLLFNIFIVVAITGAVPLALVYSQVLAGYLHIDSNMSDSSQIGSHDGWILGVFFLFVLWGWWANWREAERRRTRVDFSVHSRTDGESVFTHMGKGLYVASGKNPAVKNLVEELLSDNTLSYYVEPSLLLMCCVVLALVHSPLALYALVLSIVLVLDYYHQRLTSYLRVHDEADQMLDENALKTWREVKAKAIKAEPVAVP